MVRLAIYFLQALDLVCYRLDNTDRRIYPSRRLYSYRGTCACMVDLVRGFVGSDGCRGVIGTFSTTRTCIYWGEETCVEKPLLFYESPI